MDTIKQFLEADAIKLHSQRDMQDFIRKATVIAPAIRTMLADIEMARDEWGRFIRESEHTYFNPNWFTGGKAKADQHFSTELGRAKQALSALDKYKGGV